MKAEIPENEDGVKVELSKVKPNVKLQQARKARLVSQSILADAIGVSTRTIARWEQGKVVPFLWNIKQLCEYFDASSEDLGFEAIDERSNQEHLRNQSPLNFLTDEGESQEYFEKQDMSEKDKIYPKQFSRRKVLVGISIAATLLGGIGYGTIILRDQIIDKKQLYRYYYKSRVTSLAWSPDGTYLASAHEDHTVQVLEYQEWRCKFLHSSYKWLGQ